MAKRKLSDIERKIKDKYIFIYRMLCALLIILIPTFWIVTILTKPETNSPPIFRESLMAVSVFILFGSYKIKWIKANMQKVMMVLYALVTIWQLTVLNINNFDSDKAIGFLLVSFAISIGFEYRRFYLRFIVFFLVSVVAVLFSNSDATVNKAVFLLTLFSIQLISYFLNSSKIHTERTIVKMNTKLSLKNKETLDSINYAKRIQSAILPTIGMLEKALPNSFVLYKPKDIVSGDFYWLEEIDGIKFFAVADCTGHGVPGAMISVICHNALNRAVKEFYLLQPSRILDKTRELIVQEFEKSEETVSDGMDIILCCIKDNKLQYAGAHNPLWICRDNKLLETKADKQPIGNFEFSKKFTNHSIELQKNDIIYLNTDGYADQFGGEQGKKMKRKYFKTYLTEISSLPIQEQKEVLDTTFENWKGNFEQIDDVCIMGIKVD
jgi:serine phosphatase RsbU (regulator of sigma subunit)